MTAALQFHRLGKRANYRSKPGVKNNDQVKDEQSFLLWPGLVILSEHAIMSRMKSKTRPLSLFILVFFLLAISCSNPSESAPPTTAAGYCEQGWEAYRGGDFVLALNSFNAAIGMAGNRAEGYIGKGWTYVRIEMFANAYSAFFLAEDKVTTTDLRINVGMGYVGVALNDDALITDYLSSFTEGTDSWAHNEDPDVTAVDIHVLMAQAYMLQAVYGDETASAVNAPDAWGQVKKALELDPDDPEALALQSVLQEL